MTTKELPVEALLLDLENPRISKASSQREALQKIIEDQDVKLVVLAESICSDGLNPMDKWLVLKSEKEQGKYDVLEGNRRLAAIRILHNSSVLDDLEVRSTVKKRLEELASDFDLNDIGHIDCFEVDSRPEATTWINQRHTGENKGRGIVNWGGVATARFRGRDPALQALDLVLSHGELSDDEKGIVEDHFPISTLDRLLSTPGVRYLIGVEIENGKLKTRLPAAELIKPLRRIVLDLASETVNVTALKLKDQQTDYVSKLGKDLPDLAKAGKDSRAVDELADRDFEQPQPKPKSKPRPKPKSTTRDTLIPRDCYLTVSNPKIAEIVKELRSLPLSKYPHAVSVLFRVFLEQSVDHYLTKAGGGLKHKTKGGDKDKNLRTKVGEAVDHMIANGTPKRDLTGITKGIDNSKNPLYIETLHDYVHNRFYSPTESDLRVAWNNSQLFFETIWQ